MPTPSILYNLAQERRGIAIDILPRVFGGIQRRISGFHEGSFGVTSLWVEAYPNADGDVRVLPLEGIGQRDRADQLVGDHPRILGCRKARQADDKFISA